MARPGVPAYCHQVVRLIRGFSAMIPTPPSGITQWKPCRYWVWSISAVCSGKQRKCHKKSTKATSTPRRSHCVCDHKMLTVDRCSHVFVRRVWLYAAITERFQPEWISRWSSNFPINEESSTPIIYVRHISILPHVVTLHYFFPNLKTRFLWTCPLWLLPSIVIPGCLVRLGGRNRCSS